MDIIGALVADPAGLPTVAPYRAGGYIVVGTGVVVGDANWTAFDYEERALAHLAAARQARMTAAHAIRAVPATTDAPVSRAPLPYFHGTRARLRPGDTLHPGVTLGLDNHELGRSDVVYVTTSIGLAQTYAEFASGPGRPVVLEVVPCGPVGPDESSIYAGTTQDAYTCASATVVAVYPFD